MQDDHDHYGTVHLGTVHPDQTCADRNLVRQVERTTHCHGNFTGDTGFVSMNCLDRNRRRFENYLLRRSVHQPEHRTQGFVSFHDVAERRGEDVRVQCAVQTEHDREIVGRGVLLHLSDQPQSLLSGRKRKVVRPRLRYQYRSRRSLLGRNTFREFRDGRRFEEITHGQTVRNGDPSSTDQLGGQKRVPTEVEEVVVDPDIAHIEYVGEEVAEDLFRVVTRCDRLPLRSPSTESAVGSALTSSLPLTVIGSVSTSITTAGTM